VIICKKVVIITGSNRVHAANMA